MPESEVPVYIISKGRWKNLLTHRALLRHGIPHQVVIEPPEEDAYREANPDADLLILPFHDLGLGGIPARNWVWDHAVAEGHDRHWILDDNIRNWHTYQQEHGHHRIEIDPRLALHGVENFTSRYDNIGIAGCDYTMFVTPGVFKKPFAVNRRVYSNLLIDHRLTYRWRGRYNEDTDLCLQVLSSGHWCTLIFYRWTVQKMATLRMSGGNTDTVYAEQNGRLQMARSLERQWPRLVETKRQYRVANRAQHRVKSWRFQQVPIPREQA